MCQSPSPSLLRSSLAYLRCIASADSPKEEPEALPGGTKTDEPSAVPDPEESGPVPHPEESVYPSGQQDGETGAAADEPEETPQDTPDLSEQMLYPPRASRTRNASQNRQSSNNTNGRRAAAQNKPAANAPKRKSGRGASTRASNTKASKIAGHQAQSLLDPPLHAEIDWTGKTRCPCAQTGKLSLACSRDCA